MGLQGNVNNWRKDMLEVLKRYASQDVQRVKWSTANDEHVCPLCAANEGKTYTIAEAKKALQGEFCKPGDPDDRCRCTFIAVIESEKQPLRPIKKNQTQSTNCPKCGFKRELNAVECPKCGIIYAKYKAIQEKRKQNISQKQPPVKKRPNLTKCGDCGGDLSKRAKTCPHCGASVVKKPIRTGCGAILLVMIFAIAFVITTGDKKPTKPTETPQQKATRIAKRQQETLKRNAQKVNLTVSNYKAAVAKYGEPPAGRERIAKYYLIDFYLKDPDSLIIEGYTPLFLGPNGWQGAVKYRAKNSFGGYLRETRRFVIRQGKIVSFE